MASVRDHWPLLGLRLRTPDVVLRYPDDDDLATLALVARAGVHPPDFMPFSVPWTEVAHDEFVRSYLQYHWSNRASLAPEAWAFDLAVERAGELVGVQGLMGDAFAVRRTVSTGSWLGLAHQGKGTGKQMRAAILALAFEGLGALAAETTVLDGNAASRGVSLALGYEPDGYEIQAVKGVRRVCERFRLSRERWEATRTIPVALEGVDGCRALLGATA